MGNNNIAARKDERQKITVVKIELEPVR